MVKFCQQCGNLYNHVIGEDLKLRYQCFLCGHSEDVTEHCIVVNEFDHNAHDYQLNQNMIYDYTLPRTRKIPCPNPHCKSQQTEAGQEHIYPEIIIFQYNPEMLNVGYMCTICQNYWKN